ncbi:MAG: PQQ-binding-like beta-propeller repeat protein [Treponema sp.]|nr:PQQ-binding-like beta-propeller repeat protein [Treponema sp.]
MNWYTFVRKIAISVLFFISPHAFSNEVGRVIPLTLANASWVSAMNGRATSAPVTTSYGAVVPTDARMFSAFLHDGTTAWQRQTGKKRAEKFVTALTADFLCTVSNDSTITFLNPSGLPLWSADVGTPITEPPLQGRDGRLFVRGKNTVACYDVNGICRWRLETERLSSLPLCEFNDGSIALFVARTDNGKTRALRLSPFGEQLEEIIFAETVVHAATCADGILLVFSHGAIGMSAVENATAVSRWAYSAGAAAGTFFVPLSGHRAALISQSRAAAHATIISTEDGAVITDIAFPDISVRTLLIARESQSGGQSTLVLADNATIRACTLDGQERWYARLPPTRGDIPWNYVTLTDAQCLVFFTSTWAVIGFQIEQPVARQLSVQRSRTSDYRAFWKTAEPFVLYPFQTTLDARLTDGTLAETIRTGNYGEREASYAALVAALATAYRDYRATGGSSRPEGAFYHDASGTDALLALLPFFTADEDIAVRAAIISRETDLSHLRTLLRGFSISAYDPNGQLMNAVEQSASRIPARDDATQSALCDAIYSLCRTMGDPAFYRRGHALLSRMLYPQYSTAIHKKVRNTLTAIAEYSR